eukprot:IDg22251t1
MQIVRRGMKGPAVRRVAIKALTGRGRRQPLWKNILHQVLRDEFMRLRSAGVKINRRFLLEAAIDLLSDPIVPFTQNEIEDNMQKPLHNILTMKWIDDFCNRFKITTRIRTGNKSLSPAETA